MRHRSIKLGFTRVPRIPSRFSDCLWRRKRNCAPKNCLLGRRRYFVFLFRLRQDEGGFAGPLQLQLLANFHLLFAAAFLQAADALLAAVVLEADVGIPFLQFANLATLVEERLETLRSAQKHPSISAGENHQQHKSGTSLGALKQGLKKGSQVTFITFIEKNIHYACYSSDSQAAQIQVRYVGENGSSKASRTMSEVWFQ